MMVVFTLPFFSKECTVEVGLILSFSPLPMSLQKMGPMMWITSILLLIGGLNWGLVGIGGFTKMNLNVVNLILGSWPTVEWIVYILVGLSALYLLIACLTKKDM